jgi:hypothetical protein
MLDDDVVEREVRGGGAAHERRHRPRRPQPPPQPNHVEPLEEPVAAGLEPSLPVELDALEETAEQALKVGGRILDGVVGVLRAVGRPLGARRGDDQRAVAPQHACHFGEHGLGSRDVLDRLEGAHCVERLVVERKRGEVHHGELDIRSGVPGPRVRDCLRVDVDAQHPSGDPAHLGGAVADSAGRIQHVPVAAPRRSEAVSLEVEGDDTGLRLVRDDALGVAQGASILARTLRLPVSRRALDLVVPALAGATVVAFAAGSSSVAEVKEIALPGRWVVLAALAAAAAASASGVRGLPIAVPLAAAGFVLLALVSALWSVEPRLSAGRGLSLALLFGAAVLVGAGARASPSSARRVLLGLLWGAASVALLGVVLLAASYGTAVVPASIEVPPRFRGFGENPNTVPLLLALTLPVALHWGLTARTARRRAAAVAVITLFGASIVGSGSRGTLLAAAVGSALTVALTLRGGRRLALGTGAVVLAFAVAAVLQALPQEASPAPAAAGAAPAQPTPRYVDAERVYPLDSDVGRPLPGGGEPTVERSFLGTSGRPEAWRGALARAAERPVLGFGFGTEDKAFADRYYAFVGRLPENSYIGITLQLGAVGLAGLLALLAVLAASGRRALARPAGTWAAACAGVVAAGLAVAVLQSYLYSVGNIAAATFWIAAFLLPGLAASEEVT